MTKEVKAVFTLTLDVDDINPLYCGSRCEFAATGQYYDGDPLSQHTVSFTLYPLCRLGLIDTIRPLSDWNAMDEARGYYEPRGGVKLECDKGGNCKRLSHCIQFAGRDRR